MPQVGLGLGLVGGKVRRDVNRGAKSRRPAGGPGTYLFVVILPKYRRSFWSVACGESAIAITSEYFAENYSDHPISLQSWILKRMSLLPSSLTSSASQVAKSQALNRDFWFCKPRFVMISSVNENCGGRIYYGKLG